jgi:60 kDa SS-A/Ro ribonucleoprotein
MIWAQRHRVEADVFIVLTDNETTFRDVHPVQAMHQYRGKTGIPARLAVLGMTSAGFALSDPEDSSMLDIAGFDLSVPAALRAFVADQSLRAENTGA